MKLNASSQEIGLTIKTDLCYHKNSLYFDATTDIDIVALHLSKGTTESLRTITVCKTNLYLKIERPK